MASNARNLANLLGTGETTISASKLGDDVPPGTEDYLDIDSLGSGSVIGETAFVQGTNRLYLWNGLGWYNIALINTTPTWDSGGQPASSYVLDRDSPQDATVITLAASDPEGLPIAYSYVTSGSMDSMATISQDSSVFTITPKTVTEVGENVELTGSITFRVSDGVNILPHVSSFTLSFILSIENSRYTTLLVTATDTSDNNNITDSSTNNHTITVNGDAHAGTFSPYRHGGYSWDFEGGTNAVSGQVTEGEAIVAYNNSSDYNVGTNDYSIECWFKHRTPTTYTTNENFRICEFNDIPNGGSNDRISLQHNNVGNINVKENGSVVVTTTSTPCDGEWHFIQVIRTGGTTAVYIDGTQEASASSSTSIGAISRIVVGARNEYSYGFDGQIADFRFSNTARTAGTPTERLTSDSNTKLLVCTKPYLVDESGTATSLSLAKSSLRSDPSTKPFGPYDYDEYSASDNGGSVAFEAGDYLTVPDSDDWNFGSGDFTIEFWAYPTNWGSNNIICAVNQWASPGSGFNRAWVVFVGPSYLQLSYSTDGSNQQNITSSSPPVLNSWVHVAITRSGNTVRIFKNGILTGSSDIGSTTFYNSNSVLAINGETGSTYGRGDINIADLRIVKGTAVYTSAFTPPTTPQSSSGTALHIKGTDASIIDKSQGGNLELHGNTTGSTTQVKFADTKSMYFDGNDGITANGIRIPTTQYTHWTLEAWVYATTSDANTERQVFSQYEGDTFGNRFLFGHAGGAYRLFNGGSSVTSGPGVIQFNTWQHIAATYNGSTASADFGKYTLWVDGVSQGSMTLSRGANNSDLQIGSRNQGSTNPWLGYIQDARLTVGLLRYTANFTPPTAPLKG